MGKVNFKTERTTIKRIPERANYEPQTVYDIIDNHFLCHIAFVDQGAAFAIPTAYCRIGDSLYIHGATKSRMIQCLAQGQEVCVTITHIDGLVLARSAFHHSINYRSVVLMAKSKLVEDDAMKMKMFEAFVEHVIPGRWAEVRWPNEKEMKATHVIEIPITEVSAKIRTGDPKDDEADMALDCWAGVIPLELKAGEPVNDHALREGIVCPPYVKNYGY